MPDVFMQNLTVSEEAIDVNNHVNNLEYPADAGNCHSALCGARMAHTALLKDRQWLGGAVSFYRVYPTGLSWRCRLDARLGLRNEKG